MRVDRGYLILGFAMVLTYSWIVVPLPAFACAQSGAPATAGADFSDITQGDATGEVTYTILNTCITPADITRVRFYFTRTYYEIAPSATQNPPSGWTAQMAGNGARLTFDKDGTPTNSISEGEFLAFEPVLQGPGAAGTPLRNENYEYADNYFDRVRIWYSDGTNVSFWNPNPIGYCTPNVNCAAPTAWGWLFHGLKIVSIGAGPDPVDVGATITVTITIANRLNAPYQANGVTTTLTPSNPLLVLLLIAPPPANIPAGTSSFFVHTYQAISAGSLFFTGTATGTRSGSTNVLTTAVTIPPSPQSNWVTINGSIRPLEWREIF